MLDLGLAADDRLDAIARLADACQSRCTTADRLLDVLASRPRVGGRDWFVDVLADVRDGTSSVLEHGYLTLVERPHALPQAQRQVRSGRTGVVYRDATYDGPHVELDGQLFHDTADARDRDLERDLDAALDGAGTVRLGWGQVFRRACSTAVKVGALLQRRGWPGAPVACGSGCAVERAA